MKRMFGICILICGMSLIVQAQTADETSEVDYKSYKLTTNQKEEIRKINLEYADKFRAVGQDRSLRGYEKGQKKRALGIEKKEKIRAILAKGNATSDRTYKYSYDEKFIDTPTSREDAIRKIEAQIDRAEGEYKIEKANIKESSKDKYEYKRREKALKDEYKRRKARLKQEKEAIKNEYR